MYVLILTTETQILMRPYISNNSLISASRAAGVSPNIIRQVTKDPTLLSSTGLNALNITTTEHAEILKGYTGGFRAMFILNAFLTACAAVVSYLMIQHKELTREDDAQRKNEALKEVEMERMAHKKEIDEERVDSVVPDSAATLAAIQMESREKWLAHRKHINDERLDPVVRDSTATLAVDEVEGKEMRFSRTKPVGRKRSSTIVPDSTATLSINDVEIKQHMQSGRTIRVAKGSSSTIVPDSTATLVIDDEEEQWSTPAKRMPSVYTVTQPIDETDFEQDITGHYHS